MYINSTVYGKVSYQELWVQQTWTYATNENDGLRYDVRNFMDSCANNFINYQLGSHKSQQTYISLQNNLIKTISLLHFVKKTNFDENSKMLISYSYFKIQERRVYIHKQNMEAPSTQSNRTNPPQHERQYSCCAIFKGAIGCLGGLFIHLIISSLYQWGIINTYVTSYFKVISDPEITLQDNAIVFPVMMISIGLTMRLGLIIAKKIGTLPTLYLCNVICSGCVFASSYMEDFGSFIAFYGILFGLFAGLTFMIPIVQCNKYFPGRRMYINGFILIGTGLGSVIFGTFSYNFLNPEGLSPDEGYYVGGQLDEIAKKVPENMRFLSLLYLIIGCFGTSLLIPVSRYNTEYVKTHKVIEIGEFEAQSISQGLCSLVFWKKVLVLLLATSGVFLINGNYKTYVKQEIKDDEFLTLIGTFGAIGNGFSRFLWNLLFNRTGYKFVMLLNIFLCIIILGSLRFTIDTPVLYLFMVFLMNCCLGGYLVITPTFSQLVFGQQTGSNMYGFYWETYSIANFIQFAFVSGLNDLIGFQNIIYICTGMCVLSIPLVVTTTWEGPWKNSLESLQYFKPEKFGNKIANQNETAPSISVQMMLKRQFEPSQNQTQKSLVKPKTFKHGDPNILYIPKQKRRHTITHAKSSKN